MRSGKFHPPDASCTPVELSSRVVPRTLRAHPDPTFLASPLHVQTERRKPPQAVGPTKVPSDLILANGINGSGGRDDEDGAVGLLLSQPTSTSGRMTTARIFHFMGAVATQKRREEEATVSPQQVNVPARQLAGRKMVTRSPTQHLTAKKARTEVLLSEGTKSRAAHADADSEP